MSIAPNLVLSFVEEISGEGVRLERSYVLPKCSPSRAALLTGLYPWRYHSAAANMEQNI
jgi:arylsulfatase A-like enzyme